MLTLNILYFFTHARNLDTRWHRKSPTSTHARLIRRSALDRIVGRRLGRKRVDEARHVLLVDRNLDRVVVLLAAGHDHVDRRDVGRDNVGPRLDRLLGQVELHRGRLVDGDRRRGLVDLMMAAR